LSNYPTPVVAFAERRLVENAAGTLVVTVDNPMVPYPDLVPTTAIKSHADLFKLVSAVWASLTPYIPLS